MAEIIPIECLNGEVLGCTYSNATNYNPLATFDDGSCIFPAITTGNTFEVNIFASHYKDCVPAGDETYAFFLHIPTITPATTVTDFHMYVTLYAYDYVYNQSGSSSLTQTPCFVGTDYQNDNILTLGDVARVANNRKQVIYLNNLTPSYVNVFSAVENDTNLDNSGAAGTEFIPVEITIYSDGVKYTGSGNIIMTEAAIAVDDTVTITVN